MAQLSCAIFCYHSSKMASDQIGLKLFTKANDAHLLGQFFLASDPTVNRKTVHTNRLKILNNMIHKYLQILLSNLVTVKDIA